VIDYQAKQQKNHSKVFLDVVDKNFFSAYELVRERTMLSPEALYDLWNSIGYSAKKGLTGDILEFGVWKGGALELAAHALKYFKTQNTLIGLDTFEGHPEPNKDEVDIWGNNMNERFHLEVDQNGSWVKSNYEEVLKNLNSIFSNFRLIKGKVSSETNHPEISKIAILRLDMDWYEPTKAALENFYHRIESGGSLIIDDYGHHSGARKATDEFLEENNISLNFRHLNYSCIAATVL
jgi:hypothetical protein